MKVYKYVKQVTNLAAPAAFRAQVRYRWLDAHGHSDRSAPQRRTPALPAAGAAVPAHARGRLARMP